MTLGAKLWRMIRRYLVTIIIVFLLCILSFIIIAGYWFDWAWTGVNPSIGPQVQQYQPGKTLWDWMQLLFVPALLALGAVWFTSRQNHDLQIARAQHQHDLELTEDNQRETALQAYIDKMSGL
jgi:hypothetical protein